jgi:hypothetical protein
MVAKGILFVSSGLASMGPEGEKLFGRSHFLDLLSAFASPMVLAARHGATELGDVDPMAVQQQKDGPTVLLLGGRSWKVIAVEWSRRTVWVEPTDEKGKSRWLGTSRWLGFEVCQAMRRVLLQEGDADWVVEAGHSATRRRSRSDHRARAPGIVAARAPAVGSASLVDLCRGRGQQCLGLATR